MSQSIRLFLTVALAVPFVGGCITINALGGGPTPLRETVVHGKKGPKVLMLEIDGMISERAIRGALGVTGRESTVARVREQLDKAEKNKDIEAILLRIDSPGGTVTASDVIYRELLDFKQKHEIPIVAQMMGVAASGGYYVAMASDRIIAQPTTITGSIGVISAGVNLTGLMQKVGVQDQTFTSGPMKDAGSPLRPMTQAERAYIQGIIDELDDRFEQVVAVGRPALSKGELERLADGRAYTAGQAEKAGLVDAIGYLPDAVEELKRRLGADDVRVISYHREQEWRKNLYSARATVPPTRADLVDALGPYRGPAFLYLWQPGL